MTDPIQNCPDCHHRHRGSWPCDASGLVAELRARSWPGAGHKGACSDIGSLMRRAADALEKETQHDDRCPYRCEKCDGEERAAADVPSCAVGRHRPEASGMGWCEDCAADLAPLLRHESDGDVEASASPDDRQRWEDPEMHGVSKDDPYEDRGHGNG